MARAKPALWRCPKCGAQFTTRNQWHSCGTFSVDDLFARSEPHVRPLYELFLRAVAECGPATVIAQKSRIAIQVRMRFAALMPQKSCLKGHLVLARRHESPCFEKVETYSPRNHVHVFRLTSADQLTSEFKEWIADAYHVGCQQHLDPS